jgi:hypothetical protein
VIREELAYLLSPLSLRASPNRTRRQLLDLRDGDLSVEERRAVGQALAELDWRRERGFER